MNSSNGSRCSILDFVLAVVVTWGGVSGIEAVR